MIGSLILTILVIIAALGFDFVNGFHDAANSIATIVATKVLKPRQAVLWGAFFNFAALFLFGTGVAKTVGSGMIALDIVTPLVILSGLIGAIGWGLITWWFGIPTSSSHALIGSYAGAAMANSALHHGWNAFYDPIVASGWTKTLVFIVIAPLIGLVLGHVLMKLAHAVRKSFPSKRADLSRRSTNPSLPFGLRRGIRHFSFFPALRPEVLRRRIKFSVGYSFFLLRSSASCMAVMTRRKPPALSLVRLWRAG